MMCPLVEHIIGEVVTQLVKCLHLRNAVALIMCRLAVVWRNHRLGCIKAVCAFSCNEDCYTNVLSCEIVADCLHLVC